MVFRLFWILTRKTCVFAGKFLAGLSKILWRVQWNIYRANFPTGSLENSRIFENFLKLSGQGLKNFSRVGKTAIDVRGNSIWKLFSKREKFALFFRFWANVYFQRNFLPELRNPQSMYPWKFLGKNNFWNIYNLSHFTLFSDSDPKNA